jgi:hypothetical protein
MKLELKHLTGYLPYGLKAEIIDYKCDYVGRQYDTIIGFHQWDSLGAFWSVLTDGGAKPDIKKIKPILRPLSDLTKNKFRNDFNDASKHIFFDIGSFSDFAEYLTKEDYILSFPFDLIQWLIERHFDIYGLIEAKLAIDINTLNQ